MVTEPFEPIVDAFAPTVGMAHYPGMVSVPHPIAPLDDDALAKIAEGVIDDAVAALTA